MSGEALAVHEVAAAYALKQSTLTVPVGHKLTEVGVIPDDWECAPLGVGAQLISGHHVMARYCNSKGIGTPYLTGPADFVDGRIQHTKFTTNPGSVCKTGDILVTVKGSGSGFLVEADGRYCISRQLMALRVEKWDSSFIYYSMMQNSSEIRSASVGLIPGLSRSDILDQKLPIPRNLIEQGEIATVLKDLDTLLQELDRLIAKKRDIKQAAMQRLLTGQARLPGFEGEWDSVLLGKCLLAAPDYGINAAAAEESAGGLPYLRITDISEDGKYRPSPAVAVSSRGADEYLLSVGDVVFARTGASVGKSYLYRIDDGQLVFAGFLIRVQPDQRVLNSAFLAEYVKTGMYWAWIRIMSQRSGQPGVNGKEYAQLPIPLPCIEEQSAISEVLNNMELEIEELETRRVKLAMIKHAMMQELLTGRSRLV